MLSYRTLLLPTFILGALSGDHRSVYRQKMARRLHPTCTVGRLTALNTAGGVIGSLLVGFALIPLAGLQQREAILACLNLIIGLVASWFCRTRETSATCQPGIAAGVALIMLLPDKHYLGFREGICR
ncbi:MAG: hypothetical protein R3A44_44630 [Caldilineaceae bacterium]